MSQMVSCDRLLKDIGTDSNSHCCTPLSFPREHYGNFWETISQTSSTNGTGPLMLWLTMFPCDGDKGFITCACWNCKQRGFLISCAHCLLSNILAWDSCGSRWLAPTPNEWAEQWVLDHIQSQSFHYDGIFWMTTMILTVQSIFLFCFLWVKARYSGVGYKLHTPKITDVKNRCIFYASKLYWGGAISFCSIWLAKKMDSPISARWVINTFGKFLQRKLIYFEYCISAKRSTLAVCPKSLYEVLKTNPTLRFEESSGSRTACGQNKQVFFPP